MALRRGLSLGLGLGLGGGAGAGGGYAGTWTPSDLNGIIEWWDADEGITTETGVSAWAGQMGNLDAAQATASRQPAFSTGPNKVTGDGVDDVLQIPDTTLPYGADPVTMFSISLSRDTSSSQGCILAYGRPPDLEGAIIRQLDGDVEFTLGASNEVSVTPTQEVMVVVGRSPAVAGDPVIINVSGTKTTGVGTGTKGTVNPSDASAHILAAPRFVANGNADADVYAVGFVDGQLSDDDVQRIEGWAAHKMNAAGVPDILNRLPVDHPYKTDPPYRLWTPSDLPSVIEWWDGDEGVTEETGVSAWAGQMGNITATQTTTSRQPTYNATTPRSLSSDLVDDRLEFDQTSLPFGTDPVTVFAIAKSDQFSDQLGNITGYGSGSPTPTLQLMTTRARFAGYTESTDIVEQVNIMTGSMQDGLPIKMSVSGYYFEDAASATLNIGTGNTGYILGRAAFGDRWLDGELYAVGYVAGYLELEDIQRIEGWAAHMMNGHGVSDILDRLPVSHPYKDEAPRVGVPPKWTPSDLPGVIEWWDAREGITQETGVSNWAGRMGNLDAVQATTSKQPAYNASPAYLTCDAVDDRLEFDATVMPLGTNPVTVFAISDARNSTGNQSLVTSYGDTDTDVGYMQLNHWTGRAQVWMDASPIMRAQDTTLSDEVAILVGRTPAVPGDPMILNVSGTKTVGTDTETPNITLAPNELGYIFARPRFGNYYQDGDVYAVGYVAGHLSDADVRRIEGWAAHIMNDQGVSDILDRLPVDHPYKTEAPRK